ncbi:helix-turn-helix domain-containing protein [Acinetobacter sp. Marseille-Q1618]|uniref:helix-turn-helix domain-containing protein n=1 Tax=Acinetobacter sp. Marseille-Q1618 TaxID=2697502 RepID=UPI00156E5B7C|nr:helix-turn-helix domain-containing protein [Acinetobacter sp. Marseille-Q1618]
MNNKDDDLSAFIDGAKRVKQLIKDQNIKQADIVNALKVSKGTVSNWLQGSTTPNAQSLIELAKFLGVTERWILEGKEQKSNSSSASTATPNASGTDLKHASVEQLMNELKSRYAELNLKAEIKINVEPIDGGFVTQTEHSK